MDTALTNRIANINKVIDAYFTKYIGTNRIKAKDLMPEFIQAGVYPSDHREGLPIRNDLRQLDASNKLHLIPTLLADRKEQNTNWYFQRNPQTKTYQLNELFDRWEKDTPEYEGVFIRDGIIDEELWNAPDNKRILFIAKEANDKGVDHKSLLMHERDFRVWWNGEISHAFSYRIAEWAHGIKKDFPEFDSFYEQKEWHGTYSDSLRSIAFMDVKKSAGKGSANHDLVLKAITDHREQLLRQIEIIQPELIVSSLVERELMEALFESQPGDIQWQKSGYVRCIFKWKGIPVIDFYHPSGQGAPAAIYSLLQNIVRSPQFNQMADWQKKANS